MNMIKPVVGVRVEAGPTIMLASGKWFDLLDPSGSDFDIEDVATGLSNICRYAGQCKSFYSVAEHSIYVSQQVSKFAYEALLHDAAEAFLGDVTRPLKQLLPDYKKLETRVENAIIERFGMRAGYKPEVKKADLRVLAAEQRQIMSTGCADWAFDAGIAPAGIRVRCLSPEAAKKSFLERFSELSRQRTL